MNLSTIDIRLLLVFEALMRERSVSRAAQDVGMSQPAVSRALTTLRDMLKDELFVRTPSGMLPTAQARDLAPSIREVLARLQGIFEPAMFAPSTSTRTFRLAISDHCASLIGAELGERVRQAAPSIKLRIRPRRHATVVSELDMGEIDCAMGVAIDLPSRISQSTLFTEPYICVMRPDHPLADGALRYEDYIASEHLAVTHTGEPIQTIDVVLRTSGTKRRIAMTANQALLAPEILRRSNLILTTHLNLARRLPAYAGLHLAALPISLPPLPVRLYWHRDVTGHSAQAWFRQMIANICMDLALDEPNQTRPRGTAKRRPRGHG